MKAEWGGGEEYGYQLVGQKVDPPDTVAIPNPHKSSGPHQDTGKVEAEVTVLANLMDIVAKKDIKKFCTDC